jgi:hypothetical protein
MFVLLIQIFIKVLYEIYCAWGATAPVCPLVPPLHARTGNSRERRMCVYTWSSTRIVVPQSNKLFLKSFSIKFS